MYINDKLPSETLLNSFKRLEARDVVKAREVCKLWWKLVDENSIFWRRLELSERRLQQIQEVIDQFDEKSGSTMEEISMVIKYQEDQDFNQEDQDFTQLNSALCRSKETLSIVNMSNLVSHSQAFDDFSLSLLHGLPNLVDFRATGPIPTRVRLLKSSATIPQSLQVLWISTFTCNSLIHLHLSHTHLFQKLISLKVVGIIDHFTWRSALVQPSQTLKHLGMRFYL